MSQQGTHSSWIGQKCKVHYCKVHNWRSLSHIKGLNQIKNEVYISILSIWSKPCQYLVKAHSDRDWNTQT